MTANHRKPNATDSCYSLTRAPYLQIDSSLYISLRYMTPLKCPLPQVVKVLLGFDGDPNLPNDKEVTPIDICKDEEILRLLKGEVKIETQMKLKGRRTKKDQSEELATDEAKRDTSSSDVVMSHTYTDSSNLDHNIPTISAASTTALIMTPRPKGVKPKGGFYSDISSSESESDYFESVSKKAAKVVRLPRFQRESEVLKEVSEAQEVDNDSVGKRSEETPSQEKGVEESHEKEQVSPVEPIDSSETGGIPTCTSESPIGMFLVSCSHVSSVTTHPHLIRFSYKGKERRRERRGEGHTLQFPG